MQREISLEECTSLQADLQAAIAQATTYQDQYNDAIVKISKEENDQIVALKVGNDRLQRALSEAK